MTTDISLNIEKIERNLTHVIRGKDDSIRLVLIGLLAGGHMLLEDVPGTGKTTLAKALARSIDGRFGRIQCTPDLLPADITGSSFYRPQDGGFEFREGPVFSNILLSDEINRTSPRTQSALLEAMSEQQVTIDGKRRDLPSPFFVIATQNSAEFHGTYPLPEAQLDRFAVRVSLGYPDTVHELEILYSQTEHHPIDDICPVVTCGDIIALQQAVKEIRFEKAVAEYLLHIVEFTRADTRLRLGISPRGSLMLFRCAQARAFMEKREFVLPEDIRVLAPAVLSHRLMLDTKAKYSGLKTNHVIEEALDQIPVPR